MAGWLFTRLEPGEAKERILTGPCSPTTVTECCQHVPPPPQCR